MKENREYSLSCDQGRALGSRLRNAVFDSMRRIGGFGVKLRPWATGLLACGLLLSSCSKEPLEVPGEEVDGLTTITFMPEAMGDVDISTRSLQNVDENKVNDVWVIQLNSTGTARLVDPRYFTGGQLSSSGGKYSVRMKIKAQESRIYFIANTNNSTLFENVTTESDLQAKSLTVTSEASLINNQALPMSGYLSGTPTKEKLSSITLTRAVAKMTFKLAVNLPSGASFALTSVKVMNVPKVQQYWRNPDELDPGTTAAKCYPATTVGFGNSFDITPPDKSLSTTAKEIGWCYLPENGRGTGIASTQQHKDVYNALGGPSGQGYYATYIEIKGNYTNGLTYSACYRIYLGADALNDYNVKRNTHYTVTTIIKGVDENDSRIDTDLDYTTLPNAYDYTNNGSAIIFGPNTISGTYTWAEAQSACPAGWTLPNPLEALLLTWAHYTPYSTKLNPALQPKFQESWTNTECPDDKGKYAYTWGNGSLWVSSSQQTNRLAVTCVRRNTNTKLKYPYITYSNTYPTIVTRENGDGLKTVNPQHSSTYEVYNDIEKSNGVSSRFYISTKYSDLRTNLWDAPNCCVDGWRLPTVGEMALIIYFGYLDKLPKWTDDRHEGLWLSGIFRMDDHAFRTRLIPQLRTDDPFCGHHFQFTTYTYYWNSKGEGKWINHPDSRALCVKDW